MWGEARDHLKKHLKLNENLGSMWVSPYSSFLIQIVAKNLGHFTIKLAETTTIYLLQTFLLEISTLAAFWNPVINIKYSVKIHEMFHCQNFLFSAFHLFIHSNKQKALAFKLYDYFFYQKRCHLPKSFSWSYFPDEWLRLVQMIN